MRECYIFGIDGTITNVEHRRHYVQCKPKRWDLFNAAMTDDLPVSHIIDLIYRLSRTCTIVLVTGREEVYRGPTEKWLHDNSVHFDFLFMRPEKDFRADDIVKAEILEQMRENLFLPLMAFDDRNSVVAMWRKLGVPCAQVAEGDF